MPQLNTSFQAPAEQMFQDIKAQIELTTSRTGMHKLSDKVMDAFKAVPRDCFVGPEEKEQAYFNMPLPIGEGQTIAQPFIGALMTELLNVSSADKILEIGTGSGYHSAVLSKLAAEVYTVEVFPRLAKLAQVRFDRFSLHNIHMRIGNGVEGWKEYAPYHKILVTAATEKIPQTLLDQLSVNGIMVIPIGKQGELQWLTVVTKDAYGRVTQKPVLEANFVPLLY